MPGEMIRRTREMASRRAMAIAHRVGPTVRPLVCLVNSRYTLFGSSVLVEFGSELFLFTAAHVLDQPDLLIGIPEGFTGLGGEAIKSAAPEGRRSDDREDVGIVRLSDRCRDVLAGVAVLSAADIDVDDDALDSPTTKHYLVAGFPTSKARFMVAERRARFEGFVLTSRPAKRDDYVAVGITDLGHIVLDFEQETTRTSDGRGSAPKVNGVSGGGIWNLGTEYSADGVGARLAAIAIEWRRRKPKVIIGTRVSLYCEVLRQHRPDLTSVIPKSRRLQVKER